MEQPSQREQHLQADSVRADYGRVRNALNTAVRLKLKAQTEADRLRAVNQKLLAALEEVSRISGENQRLLGDTGGVYRLLANIAGEAIEEAKK